MADGEVSGLNVEHPADANRRIARHFMLWVECFGLTMP
jgi:hypothetical protein